MRKNVFVVVTVGVVVLLTVWLLSGAVTPKDVDKALTPFYQTLSYILNAYYERDSINLDKLIDSAIDGLVKGLGDDFSYYEGAEEVEEKQIEMEGEYGGLGIEVTYDSEYKAVKVIAPMYGTPAWRAGLKPGDRIVSIDDQPVSEMQYMEAVRKLRGQPGTKVKIKVLREGVQELLTFEIVREVILIIPVKHAYIVTQ
ncbi:MAG: S41 family peptidase, partial [Pseudothermotoga sp.]